jgi:outer membrane lipoprotein-sorting protein
MIRRIRGSTITRIGGLAIAAAFGAWISVAPVAAAPAAGDMASAQKIADHFSSVRTMAGEFVQFGPQGQQTAGSFYLERPGKIRFNYEPPSAYQVISDGKSIVISNKKLHTNDLYSLSATPLKLLLADRIDLSGGGVSEVRQDEDLTTIVMSDKSVFGNAKITMMFDPESYELRQWTVTDAQGKDTTVMVFNVQSGVKLDRSLFDIDYARIAENTFKRSK